MATIRINKTDNYTVMSNHHLRNKDMSLKAKGLLSMMLSLPPDWDYSIRGLCAICKENETAIKSTLQELKRFRHLIITKKMPNETNSGRIEYIYDIYEIPLEKQDIENLSLENLDIENQRQLNTKEISIKELKEEEVNAYQHYYHLNELSLEQLEELKQTVLVNRETKELSYRNIQIKFNLIDKVTFDTPEECDNLIKQIKDKTNRTY